MMCNNTTLKTLISPNYDILFFILGAARVALGNDMPAIFSNKMDSLQVKEFTNSIIMQNMMAEIKLGNEI